MINLLQQLPINLPQVIKILGPIEVNLIRQSPLQAGFDRRALADYPLVIKKNLPLDLAVDIALTVNLEDLGAVGNQVNRGIRLENDSPLPQNGVETDIGGLAKLIPQLQSGVVLIKNVKPPLNSDQVPPLDGVDQRRVKFGRPADPNDLADLRRGKNRLVSGSLSQ